MEPLFTYIIQKNTLIVSTNEAKYTKGIGDSCIIALEYGKITTQRYNPNFWKIRYINSYRVEIYASLAARLFLQVYSQLYMVKLENEYTSICDN